jgi:hypothetical protein
VPYVVMRSNVDLVLERLSADRSGEPGAPDARPAEKRTATSRPRSTSSRRRPSA